MVYILNLGISAFMFPGVVVHELAHQLFCRLCRISVNKVVYFQLDIPCGYVDHEKTQKPMQNFLLVAGPFIVNTLLGVIMVIPAYIGLYSYNTDSLPDKLLWLVYIVLLWLGVAVLMHAFPGLNDARVLITSILKDLDVPFIIKVLLAPIISLIYIGALVPTFCSGLIYAGAITFLVPRLFLLNI